MKFPLHLRKYPSIVRFMSTITAREQLLMEIERFLKKTRLPQTKFGQLAANDMSLIKRLRDGHDVRTATADRLREFMREYRDENRPLGPRPKANVSAAA